MEFFLICSAKFFLGPPPKSRRQVSAYGPTKPSVAVCSTISSKALGIFGVPGVG